MMRKDKKIHLSCCVAQIQRGTEKHTAASGTSILQGKVFARVLRQVLPTALMFANSMALCFTSFSLHFKVFP
jgi:hypothetical protein